jgi:hypothetical protein
MTNKNFDKMTEEEWAEVTRAREKFIEETPLHEIMNIAWGALVLHNQNTDFRDKLEYVAHLAASILINSKEEYREQHVQMLLCSVRGAIERLKAEREEWARKQAEKAEKATLQ